MSDLIERSKGKWRDILLALGVETKFLTGKHAPCPFCGGKDRFRFTPRTELGAWICNQCGSGWGMDFVSRLRRVDFAGACKLVETVIGAAHAMPIRKEDPEARRKQLNTLWRGAKLITLNDPAGRYLTMRGLVPPLTGTALRWHPLKGAMLAKVCDSDGKPTTLQQTFLTPDAVKTERKTFWGRHSFGSAVRLAPPVGVLGIAEGVETALSATTLFSIVTWAALDASHLEKWEPPKGIDHVVIFADNDKSFTGQAAAWNLAKRLHAAKITLQVLVPPEHGEDWNDVLRRERAEPMRAAALH
jgi:putative DNA primase/helicase